jgi:hypothetical protein
MANNPYTRSTTITIVEVVPDRDQLPTCSAVLMNDEVALCSYKARYVQNEKPVCGVHVGRPGVMFWDRRAR